MLGSRKLQTPTELQIVQYNYPNSNNLGDVKTSVGASRYQQRKRSKSKSKTRQLKGGLPPR